MAGTALNLSLLSRGIGEVKRNGHEKVDVVLEPEDYFNYAEDTRRIYLPPIEPTIAFGETPREVHLPKTFTTRKGALLLFSEDYAQKTRAAENPHDTNEGKTIASSFDDLDLRTVDDLTRSILSYGSHKDEINLRFVRNQTLPRRFRPGYSARRYLSRLTKSFDDSFLDKLMSKGFVQEKTLYQYNSLLPKLRRRINDDLSALPAPYRIMKQMLMAPGLLSGYNFYTGKQDTIYSDLTILEEEEETGEEREAQKSAGVKVVEVKEGVTRTVSYSDLAKEDKENVLADLLVKSAINHALEKQKQKMQGESGKTSPTSAGQEVSLTRSRHASIQSGASAELDMAEALMFYLESQIDHESIGGDGASTSHSESLKGSKLSTRSTRSIEAPPAKVPDASGDGASVKSTASDTRSVGSRTRDQGPSDIIPQPLSPIKDEGSYIQSRETTFNANPVLPPIRPVVQTLGGPAPDLDPVTDKDAGTELGVPQVNIQPPTPQHSSLMAAGASPKPTSREPTVAPMAEETESEEGSEKAWKSDIDERELLEADEDESKKRGLTKKGSTQSLMSAISVDSARGPALGGSLGGSPLASSMESISDAVASSHKSFGSMRGHALRTTKTSQKTSGRSSKKGSDTSSQKGSMILGPGGAVVMVGGAISGPSEASVEVVSEVNKMPDAADDDDKRSVGGKSHVSSQSHISKFSARSGYSKSIDDLASEQELVEALADQAHKIASSILAQQGTGRDLGADAQAAVSLWLDNRSVPVSRTQSERNLASYDAAVDDFFPESEREVKSAAPTSGEYRELLKETLSSALSSSNVEVPADAEVSDELVQALANQNISPDDITVFRDENGKSVISVREEKRVQSGKDSQGSAKGKVKEGHTYQQPKTDGSAADGPIPISIPTGRPKEADIGDPVIIHYGEGAEQDVPAGRASQGSSDGAGKKSKEGSVKQSPSRVSSVAKSAAGKSVASLKGGDDEEAEKQVLDSLAQEAASLSPSKASVSDTKSLKSGKSVKSSKSVGKSEKSRHSLQSPESDTAQDNREEFVVGKVADKDEIANLYGRKEEPPKPKEKKPRVPPAKPPVKKAKAVKKKAKGKETAKPEVKKDAGPKEKKTALTPKDLSPMPPDDKAVSPAPSGTVSEVQSKDDDEMSFIFVDDGASEVSDAKSGKSAIKSGLRSGALTQFTEGTEIDDEASDGSSPVNTAANRDARATKRAAQAAKRKAEVERKRKEREEQIRREREEADRKDSMARELEEERRRKEEERRMKREREEEERMREEEEEASRERRARMEMERQKRMKEEYQRKLDLMRRQQQEEERIRKAMEEERLKEEEERLRKERIMLSRMKAEEREEYERRKKQEEEDNLRKAEEERRRLEEESRLAMEQAKRVAAELARQQAEYERRLQFNHMLHLEAEGMETHSLNITEAFTFSYYELLKWLGMDLPEMDHMTRDKQY